jgi:hypothetical protein
MRNRCLKYRRCPRLSHVSRSKLLHAAPPEKQSKAILFQDTLGGATNDLYHDIGSPVADMLDDVRVAQFEVPECPDLLFDLSGDRACHRPERENNDRDNSATAPA